MTHDQRHDGLSADEALHSALCALALGELPADDARALEARLAAEPTLAAQYDEVRATIALVRTSLGGDEALPAAGLARVLDSARERAAAATAAASASTPILQLAWYRRPAVRLAASLVIFAGAGFIGLKALRPAEDAGEMTARVEVPVGEPAGNTELAAALGAVPSDGPVTVDSLTAVAERGGYVRGFTTGEIRQNGQPKYVDPDTEQAAIGGFNPSSLVPKPSEAFGLHFEWSDPATHAASVSANPPVEEARDAASTDLYALTPVPEPSQTPRAAGGAVGGFVPEGPADSFYGLVAVDPGATMVGGGGGGGDLSLFAAATPPNVPSSGPLAASSGGIPVIPLPMAPDPSSGASPQPTGGDVTRYKQLSELSGEAAKADGRELVELRAGLDAVSAAKNGAVAPRGEAAPEAVRGSACCSARSLWPRRQCRLQARPRVPSPTLPPGPPPRRRCPRSNSASTS